ncbi:uncharacterized protein LOC142224765 [Haematobia irritans]|uniref:uncharacterized protein LOC142224765 n=1 Tax=Haematobia irritans TaxID=7368 RepID=UPI003F50C0E1
MRKCCVCRKTDDGFCGPFFKVPSDEQIRLNWSQSYGTPLKASQYICKEHFLAADIIKGGKFSYLLSRALPIRLNSQRHPDQIDIQFHSISHNEDGIMTNTSSQCEEIREDVCMSTTTDEMEKSWWVWSRVPRLNKTKMINEETQTEWSMRTENRKLIKKLQINNSDLKIQLTQANNVVECMKNIFTEEQIRRMMSTESTHWAWDDIANAICLHAAGPRAYNHLYRKGFPLPSASTLQRWSRKIPVTEGLMTTAIDFMKHATDMSDHDKICVLEFDEMKISHTYEHDASEDFVRKPANFVQVVMARGVI